MKNKNLLKELIQNTVQEIIEKSSSPQKIMSIRKKHDNKLHFIPKKYRIFGGILQSMNIQFGNFLEKLILNILKSDGKYEILEQSGKKINYFSISRENDRLINEYILSCQTTNIEPVDLKEKFKELKQKIIQNTKQSNNKDKNLVKIKHDIDLLFKDKETNRYYFVEIKYNDDHDTGKFIDINRKIISTYAYLVNELDINDVDQLKPILFYFNNKKLKGNIYLPEGQNIMRGEKFFQEFSLVKYNDIDEFLSNLADDQKIIQLFNELYEKVVK